jgi:predicted ATPase
MPSPKQVMTPRFVGRAEELARLDELLARAAGGEPLVALVGGEAGVGKTRLAEQLAAAARERGVRVLRGGCVPLGEDGLPFAPIIQALRGLVEELDPAELVTVAGPTREELARLLPDLAWRLDGQAAAGVAAAGVGQGRLFDGLLGVVERLAAIVPLLLVMEDLHWADRSTRDLVAFLAGFLRTGRVLLLLTFRSDELYRLHPLRGLLGELARNRRVQRLELPRLTRAELAEQLAGLLGADLPARLVDDVYARCEGNPFFAEELVLAGDGTGPGGLPPSLQEVLLARVVRLGPAAQQVVRVAAAAGPGVAQPLLAAVTGMDEAQLLDGLREAVDQQLLLPCPGGEGYVFRHALVAEAVYGELLPGERVRLHTALASALEAGVESASGPATRTARLAHHWAAAGDQPRALAASLEAAATAEQVYGFAEAQLQLERALSLWGQVVDAEARAGADRMSLLSRCAEAADAAGDTGRAAWTPACSTPRCRPWRGAPAWTSPRTTRPRHRWPTRRRPPRSSASLRARPRCSPWLRSGAATARSPRRCSSVPRPPASTSPTSSPSSAPPAGSRPPRSPTASASTKTSFRSLGLVWQDSMS